MKTRALLLCTSLLLVVVVGVVSRSLLIDASAVS